LGVPIPGGFVPRRGSPNRSIEQEVDRIVEQIYQEPLFAGIETALVRTRADISDYVEDLSKANDRWLEEITPEALLN
jgi:hypothetical protein